MIGEPKTRTALLRGTDGRLTARPLPHPAVETPSPAGLRPLNLGGTRDGRLYVPKRRGIVDPMPLVVMLHGAGGTAGQVVPMLQAAAERHGAVVLAPDSRARNSWDVIRGSYGPDILFLDQALTALFEQVPIDPDRIAIGGFSDGASYALSVGLTNGDLFRDILAFSPGFAAPAGTVGRPRIFISHGDRDEILPIERCGRRLAGLFTQTGYDVDYREFAGGHVVPPDLVDAAMDRFLS